MGLLRFLLVLDDDKNDKETPFDVVDGVRVEAPLAGLETLIAPTGPAGAS